MSRTQGRFIILLLTGSLLVQLLGRDNLVIDAKLWENAWVATGGSLVLWILPAVRWMAAVAAGAILIVVSIFSLIIWWNFRQLGKSSG